MNNEFWLIWTEPKTKIKYKIGTLTYDNNEYVFNYTNPEVESASKNGFDFYPGFDDINQKYKSNKLFPNIDNRLPNKSRPDYLEILNSFDLNKESTKLEILKATRGKLVTDNYMFVPKFDENKIEFSITDTDKCKELDKCINEIELNDTLIMQANSDNSLIKVLINKKNNLYHIGFVPRYYSTYIKELLEKNIKYSAMVEKINRNNTFDNEIIDITIKVLFDK